MGSTKFTNITAERGRIGVGFFILLFLPPPPLISHRPPFPPDTELKNTSCLLSEAGVVELNVEKMPSWRDPSASCPVQAA